MKELEKKAVRELIVAYSKYYSYGLTTQGIKFAKEVYNEYIPAGTLISDEVMDAIGRLFSIAYPNVDSGIKLPSKEEVKKILEKLSKREKELKQQ